jgi:nucleoside-diphosphate-sugar epimerase
MRVLIIGCGYVGVATGAELAREGHEVFGLRRNPDANTQLLAAGIKPVSADITKSKTFKAVPANFDWVVNCASSGGGDADDYRKIYLEGTRNILNWLKDSPPRKFVYTSSTSVYGQDEGELVTETSPTEPNAETGRILVQTEKLLLAAGEARGCPAVILRFSGIYGPGRGYWFKQFLKGEPQTEENAGRILNMVHRDDAAGAIIAALEQGRSGAIYNVSDDEPVSQFELYKWLAEQLGRNSGLTAHRDRGQPASAPATRSSRRGATNKRISNTRLKSELGYRFKYPTFREGYAGEVEQIRKSAEK